MSKSDDVLGGIIAIGLGLLVLVGILAAFFIGIPIYNVWRAGKAGEAALRRAESEKRVMVEVAKAELEASEIRAQAIEALGQMAQQYPEYRNQEFIAAFADAIKDGAIHQIIYVPTEANIPITEAGHRPN